MIGTVLWFLLAPALTLFPLPLLVVAAASAVSGRAAPAPRLGCPSTCGDVQIPYPFGVGKECAWAKYFAITCKSSSTNPATARPYFRDLEIIDITVATGEIRVFSPVSYICYNSPDTIEPGGVLNFKLNFAKNTPLLISPTRNQFTAIGCSMVAVLRAGTGDRGYLSGCISYCGSIEQAAGDSNDDCTGLGCCQTSIPGNLSSTTLSWTRKQGKKAIANNAAWTYSPCNYAFVGEKGWYKFNRSDLKRDGNNSFLNRVGEQSIPLVLDWAIRRNGTCQPTPMDAEGASAKPNASACVSAHSYCVNATQGPGYLCNCSEGYDGNPYVTGPGSCTNIDECDLRKSNLTRYGKLYPCHTDATCRNTEGGYECTCKFWLRGDGKTEEGCHPIIPAYAIAILVPSLIIILACFAALELKRRKHMRFFGRNGGEILKSVGINIYTEGELRKITNGYSMPIGEGAFGKVFMGNIDSAQRVAVKRASMKGVVLPQAEFVNEITLQFRISHTNMVRLLGCCLETDIPMLVFEHVPKGSLYDVLHGTEDQHKLSLQERLGIAIGSAEALAHMHSHVDHNHVHGDVKSGNILLDNDLTPKVSDFGSSKLVCVASMYSKWCVSGDMNYIDPVYIKSGRFTEKSDVYSFGVVLLELITRKKAKYGDNSLPLDFVKCFKEDSNGRKLYDKDIMKNNDAQSHCHMVCLDKIGELAVRCLKEDVDERPTMAEVVEKLKEMKSKASGHESTQMKAD